MLITCLIKLSLIWLIVHHLLLACYRIAIINRRLLLEIRSLKILRMLICWIVSLIVLLLLKNGILRLCNGVISRVHRYLCSTLIQMRLLSPIVKSLFVKLVIHIIVVMLSFKITSIVLLFFNLSFFHLFLIFSLSVLFILLFLVLSCFFELSFLFIV